jgi:hypothetical protein
MIPQHLSLSNEHYTPSNIVEAARTLMLDIDLDPASCAKANETVMAVHWIGLPHDGLAAPWAGRVFLNPPGGHLTLSDQDVDDAIMGACVALKEDIGLPPFTKETRAKWRKHPLVKYELAPTEDKLKGEREKWKTSSRQTAWWRRLATEYEMGFVSQAVFVAFNLELLRSAQGDGDCGHPFDYSICVPSERLHFSGDQPAHANLIVYLGPNKNTFKEIFEPIGRCKR